MEEEIQSKIDLDAETGENGKNGRVYNDSERWRVDYGLKQFEFRRGEIVHNTDVGILNSQFSFFKVAFYEAGRSVAFDEDV